MKVRMKVTISGTRDGLDWPAAGGELVVPDAEGADLCAAGYADPVAEVAQPEKRPAPRKAAEKRG